MNCVLKDVVYDVMEEQRNKNTDDLQENSNVPPSGEGYLKGLDKFQIYFLLLSVSEVFIEFDFGSLC